MSAEKKSQTALLHYWETPSDSLPRESNYCGRRLPQSEMTYDRWTSSAQYTLIHCENTVVSRNSAEKEEKNLLTRYGLTSYMKKCNQRSSKSEEIK